MLTLSESFLLAFNRLLPAPALPGDADPLSYAQWEHDTSEAVLRLWNMAENASPIRSALDVGCGLGGKTARLRSNADASITWTALDIDLDHLRSAGLWFEHVGSTEISRIAADASQLPFSDHSFDRIVTADALEHLPDPRRALKEFRRCLGNEGRLVLLFNPWGSPRGSHLADLIRLPWCQLLFDRDTLERATLRAAEELARSASSAEEAEKARSFGKEIADHFRDHVHPTRISDLRDWLGEDQEFVIETELRFGPGSIGTAAWIQSRWCEEWLSATYGAVLRPLTA